MGDKSRNFTFCKVSQVSSGFVQACFSAETSRIRSDPPCTEALQTIVRFWSSVAGHEDLCDRLVPVSVQANITLSRFSRGAMTSEVRGAVRGHGTAHRFTGYLFPMAEEQLITT